MNSLSIGNTITIKELLKYGPLGLELEYNECSDGIPTKVLYDLDFYNSSPEIQKKYANAYFTSHFPSLTFIPGFILEYPNERKEILMGGWYKVPYQEITKLPIITLIKRKQL